MKLLSQRILKNLTTSFLLGKGSIKVCNKNNLIASYLKFHIIISQTLLYIFTHTYKLAIYHDAIVNEDRIVTEVEEESFLGHGIKRRLGIRSPRNQVLEIIGKKLSPNGVGFGSRSEERRDKWQSTSIFRRCEGYYVGDTLFWYIAYIHCLLWFAFLLCLCYYFSLNKLCLMICLKEFKSF